MYDSDMMPLSGDSNNYTQLDRVLDFSGFDRCWILLGKCDCTTHQNIEHRCNHFKTFKCGNVTHISKAAEWDKNVCIKQAKNNFPKKFKTDFCIYILHHKIKVIVPPLFCRFKGTNGLVHRERVRSYCPLEEVKIITSEFWMIVVCM